MGGSLKSLLKYTQASAGDAVNDHDAIATVRPVDVYAVAAEIKRLRAIVDQVPKCWRLNDAGELVQDEPVVPWMQVVCWCKKGLDGPHRITDSWVVVSVRRVTVDIKKGQTVERVVLGWIYKTREAAKAAEAAKGE